MRKCFELQEEREREGVVCEACRRSVTRNKQDVSLTYPLLVDLKGNTVKSEGKLAF